MGHRVVEAAGCDGPLVFSIPRICLACSCGLCPYVKHLVGMLETLSRWPEQALPEPLIEAQATADEVARKASGRGIPQGSFVLPRRWSRLLMTRGSSSDPCVGDGVEVGTDHECGQPVDVSFPTSAQVSCRVLLGAQPNLFHPRGHERVGGCVLGVVSPMSKLQRRGGCAALLETRSDRGWSGSVEGDAGCWSS